VLKDTGEVLELAVNGCSHYYSNITPHPHLIHTKCHNITDLPPETTSRMSEETLSVRRFHTLWHGSKIHGLCLRGLEQEEKTAEPIVTPYRQ